MVDGTVGRNPCVSWAFLFRYPADRQTDREGNDLALGYCHTQRVIVVAYK